MQSTIVVLANGDCITVNQVETQYHSSRSYPRSRFIYTALEAVRLPVEVIGLQWSARLFDRLPKGDNHPVMVLPPFMAGDQITQRLRKQIARWGYDVRGWDLGINAQTRNSDSMLEALDQRRLVSERLTEIVQQVATKAGRPVSLIGWSLGGIHAVEVAQAIPQQVRQIITLGSPLGDPRATAVYALMNANGQQSSSDEEVDHWLKGLDQPLHEVPFTCVYSDSDGIVDPGIARISDGPQRQNIQVNSTHLGMAFNARVHYVIADRLQLDKDSWHAMDTPAWLAW